MGKKIKQFVVKRSTFTMTKNGEIIGDEPEIISKKNYDIKGNIIYECEYSFAEAEVETTYIFENELCVQETINHISDDTTVTIKFEFDSNKNLALKTQHFEYGSEISKYYYDEKNLIIKKEICEEDGSIETLETFEYKDDKLIENAIYSPAETLVKKHEINVVNELETIEKHWSIDTKKYITIKYVRQEKNLDPNITIYNEEGKVIERHTKVFDDKQLLIEETLETTSHGYLKLITHHTYNIDGTLAESQTQNASDDVVKKIINEYAESQLVSTEVFEKNIIDGQILHYIDYFEHEYFE